MPTPRTNEKAFNTVFCEILRTKHPLWKACLSAEQTQVIEGNYRSAPDIVLSMTGCSPVVIESEYSPATTVETDARSRLRNILAANSLAIEHCIAIRVPQFLGEAPQHALKAEIERAEYSYCIYSVVDNEQESRWPTQGWHHGDILDVTHCIEAVSLTESLVTRSTEILQRGVDQAAQMLGATSEFVQTKVDQLLCQASGEQTNRMVCAIIANSLVFHSRIEGLNDVPTLSSLQVNSKMSKLKLLNCWAWILHDVNYWSIFKVAIDLLNQVPTTAAVSILDRLTAVTDELSTLGATKLNDLSGRMFQKLIFDRKFLATFYTLPVSATFLSELVVGRVDDDWGDPESVKSLRVADFACGTGALIGALYHSMAFRYRSNGNDDSKIHADLLENCLYAFDIMPAATHLTASTLSNVHPKVTFNSTKIVTMPYGRKQDNAVYIGSLDLLREEKVKSLLSLGRQTLIGRQRQNEENSIQSEELLSLRLDVDISADMPHESLDIVIMNPPFTRPTNHAMTEVPVPSFAGFNTSEQEQHEMSKKLKVLSRQLTAKVGDGRAGLASNFVDLAHVKLKPGGILGLVLPATFAAGSSWENVRQLLIDHYQEVTIISLTSNRPEEAAFSADTAMAEVLVIARKNRRSIQFKSTYHASELKFQYVNLLNRPSHNIEAYELAKTINQSRHNLTAAKVRFGKSDECGILINADKFNSGFVGLTEPNLAEFMMNFSKGRIWTPRSVKKFNLPIVSLGELGRKGLSHRSLIYQGAPFYKEPLSQRSIPTFPTLWAHDAKRERRLIVEPDCDLVIRPGAETKALNLWNTCKSRLHINLDFRLNSQSLTACLTSEATLGGRAWPNIILNQVATEKALAVWLNTTFGLISHW